jgi:hypothetical protein
VTISAVTAAAMIIPAAAASAAGACDSGAFCVYTNENRNPVDPHFEAQGVNASWGSAFPEVKDHDESVINYGTSGKSAEVHNWW